MKKTIIFSLILLLFAGALCYGVVQLRDLQEEITTLREEAKHDNAMIAKTFALQQRSRLDSKPHNVLCIGNSITLHRPSDKVNWHSCCGMAASKPEYDYCHMLEKMMRQHNSRTTVTPVNIAVWERNFELSLDSLLREPCKGKDIIVIRLSENVRKSDIDKFREALPRLVEYCLEQTPNVVITGTYWANSQKEQVILECAQRYNLRYVPLGWIWRLHREECCPKVGDTLYNTEGKPYQIEGKFIITHPNDRGMEMIARSIYNIL